MTVYSFEEDDIKFHKKYQLFANCYILVFSIWGE